MSKNLPFGEATSGATGIASPSAASVLHRVLADASRVFLLNDADLPDDHMTGPAPATGALWAVDLPDLKGRRVRRSSTEERVHQSRVALRRIRANLRTYRLAFDPAWGTELRGQIARYNAALGAVRDLQLRRNIINAFDPDLVPKKDLVRLSDLVGVELLEAEAEAKAEATKEHRVAITASLEALWDGAPFRNKAKRPAASLLPELLERAWRDTREAGRIARKDATDLHLHRLRIRTKTFRYSCETVGLIDGGPARKAARAAGLLQDRLGEVHDAQRAVLWLQQATEEHRGLAMTAHTLALWQTEVAETRLKGWKKDLKELERRWRAITAAR